ncbi:MAG: Cof-type HAD-IIB family hydrolase [Oscillospiraceae bacterium]|nr:Cof-type HAD-IIB family hydrolase [Oscillospiraceae bacterium]
MKLIFLDIDGTLTEPGTNIPPESALTAIRAAQAAGNKVFLCTGRNYAMLSPLLQYGFDGFVGSAGGYVVCGDEVLYDHPMPVETAADILRILHENGVHCTVEARSASYSDEDIVDFLASVSGDGNSELVRWRRALEENLHILPMHEYDGAPLYKVIFMCREAGQLAAARVAYEKDFNFVVQDAFSQGCINGEMINRAFDKGRGVRMIADKLSVPIEDTVGFGDSMNDLEMIETVGVSVCMANGSPALKERSDVVCGAVSEDGLAHAFEQLQLV